MLNLNDIYIQEKNANYKKNLKDKIDKNIFLQPCSNSQAKKNLKISIESYVNFKNIEKFLSQIEIKQIKNLIPQNKLNKLYIWGVTSRKNQKGNVYWNKINISQKDYCLFYINKKYKYFSNIIYKTNNKLLAKNIWKNDLNGYKYEWIYFLEKPKEINISSQELQNELKSKKNYTVPRSLIYIKDKKAKENVLFLIETIKNNLEEKYILKKEVYENEKLTETEKWQIISSRKGQGNFRKQLLKELKKCIITGIQNEKILEASHIKPWNNCNNKERLDKYNGILLTPNFHKLFDLGYISFDSKGELIISKSLSNLTLKKLNFNYNHFSKKNIKNWPLQRLEYLKYHRNKIFIKN